MSPRAELNLRVAVDSGLSLATDVYRPADDDRRPAVLIRTYLGKSRHRGEATGWADHGFGCVVQDVRGRFDSEGCWQPYRHERQDGAATVKWLLSQPWCDGRVVAVGGSYGAFAAWCAALAHPAVRAVISSVPAMDSMPMMPEDGGVLPLLSRLNWWLTHAGSRRPRVGRAEALLRSNPETLGNVPVADLPPSMSDDLPAWRQEVLETESIDRSPAVHPAELAGLDVAALHLGGWHDPFCAETLRQFELVGRGVPNRPPRALVVGPWWHHLNGSRPARYGERDYGPASRFPLGRFQADWLRNVLAGSSAADGTSDTSVRVFLSGENRWVQTDRWSQPALEVTSLFAVAHGADPGCLSTTPPTAPGQGSTVYDPEDPYACRRTPLDESDHPERKDVLALLSGPLTAPCRVVGTPRITLWGSTDGPAVDWVARLLEVTADGRVLYLAHGLVDASRQLAARGESLRPGVRHRVEIVLSPLGVSVPAGSRLRLEITHSAFPSYARNLGSGDSRLTGRRPRRSRQTVFWGPALHTRLDLPVHVAVDDSLRPSTSVASPVGERL